MSAETIPTEVAEAAGEFAKKLYYHPNGRVATEIARVIMIACDKMERERDEARDTAQNYSRALFKMEEERKQTAVILADRSTLEAERAKTAAATQKLRDANADRSQLLADLQALRTEMATRVTDMQDRAEAAEARERELRRERDEAVRVAAEDERDRLYEIMLVAAATTGAPVSYAAQVIMVDREGAMLPADRARLRADQRAGDGGGE